MTRTHPIFTITKSEGKKNQKTENKPSTSTTKSGPHLLGRPTCKGKAKKSKLSSSKSPNPPGPTNPIVLDPSTVENVLDSSPSSNQNGPQPSTSSSQVAPNSSTRRPRKLNDSEDDVIRATKRRLAKRQRKIVPVGNQNQAPRPLFAKCRNRIPQHRVKSKEKKGCWEGFKNCMKKGWESVKEGAKSMKAKISKTYEKVMEKKRKWDRWNPSKEHPVAKFIDECKLAGLKETIKPNRGILYRQDFILFL
jgi:hypothetical protein